MECQFQNQLSRKSKNVDFATFRQSGLFPDGSKFDASHDDDGR
jgi:hypothetical protein